MTRWYIYSFNHISATKISFVICILTGKAQEENEDSDDEDEDEDDEGNGRFSQEQ